jgi:glycosyltransferase involved in cell wall biosynthesis
MAYGVVPLSSDVSSIGQYLKAFETGRVFHPDDLDGFVNAIKAYMREPDLWQRESQKGQEAAHHFTYSVYLEKVASLLELTPPPTPRAGDRSAR